MTRPEKPPQIIAAGDMYSSDVDIFLNGKLANGSWTEIDAVSGKGTRYITDGKGKLVRDDAGEALTEVVEGNFEVVWAPA